MQGKNSFIVLQYILSERKKRSREGEKVGLKKTIIADVGISPGSESNGVVPVANVSGLLGRSARLPCDTTPPSQDNPLLLVIWFKEPSPDPIYRY